MTVSSAVFMSIPLVANYFDSYGVIVCRVIQGMAQGFFLPLSYIILSAWSPISERSTLAASVLNGMYVKTCIFSNSQTVIHELQIKKH